MTLHWNWSDHAHVAVSEPFVLVVHDHETTFDYHVFEDGELVASGTVYSLERAQEAAESALFNVMMCRATGWELWRTYLEPRGLLAPNTTPCTCRYCRMTEAEVEEYRRAIRRTHGERDE